jgi:hypothetical protein
MKWLPSLVCVAGIGSGQSDPCTSLNKNSYCDDNGKCKDVMSIGGLVEDSVYVLAPVEIQKLYPDAILLSCEEATHTDRTKEYFFNVEFFETRLDSLLQVTRDSFLPALREFPLSLQALNRDIDSVSRELVGTIQSKKLEILLSLNTLGKSNEFQQVRTLLWNIKRIVRVLPIFHRGETEVSIDRLWNLPLGIFLATPSTPSDVFLFSSTNQVLAVSHILEEMNDLLSTRSYITVGRLLIIGKIARSLASDRSQEASHIAMLSYRFRQVVCPSVYELIMSRVQEQALTVDSVSSLVFLCMNKLSVSKRIEISRALIFADWEHRSGPREGIDSGVLFNSPDHETLIRESRQVLGKPSRKHMSWTLFVVIGQEKVNTPEWLVSVSEICSDPRIFEGRDQLMLKPYSNEINTSMRLRACGRLIGLALRMNVRLGFEFDINFFALLRVISPNSIGIDSRYLSPGYLEAARYVSEGMADVVGYLAIHTLSELEIQSALV